MQNTRQVNLLFWRFIVVAQDAFSKWVEAESLSATIFRWLSEDVFSRFGNPGQITADQGSQFDSAEIKRFWQENNIDLHIISSYHYISNGLAERKIWTVETMLRTSVVDKADWRRHLPGLVWAYSTPHDWGNIFIDIWPGGRNTIRDFFSFRSRI